MRLKIYFQNSQEKYRVTYELQMLVRRAVLASLSSEGYDRDCEVSVTFTDNEGIRAINREFRDIDSPTDVLSFPMDETEESIGGQIAELGDIVLSVERAHEQAHEFGHSYEREIAFLCAHSVLHLLGYDHETSDKDEQVMREKQRNIMKMLKLEVEEND
jgi:probable rRNA maturation factor